MLKEKIDKQRFDILIPEIKPLTEGDIQTQMSRLEIKEPVVGKGKAHEEESMSTSSNRGDASTNSAKLSPLKPPALQEPAQ